MVSITSGAFAAQWIAVQDAGGEDFRRLREQDRNHQIEQVGARLRSQMSWLDPVEVSAGQAQASTTGAARPVTAAGEGEA